mmetsp:Transcript_26402/g.90253  ORF Transcript_26402/g.90253 Transcript_26402/m.90253 type:complete len:271 (-) Transcript_26402:1842-2654(-)
MHDIIGGDAAKLVVQEGILEVWQPFHVCVLAAQAREEADNQLPEGEQDKPIEQDGERYEKRVEEEREPVCLLQAGQDLVNDRVVSARRESSATGAVCQALHESRELAGLERDLEPTRGAPQGRVGKPGRVKAVACGCVRDLRRPEGCVHPHAEAQVHDGDDRKNRVDPLGQGRAVPWRPPARAEQEPLVPPLAEREAERHEQVEQGQAGAVEHAHRHVHEHLAVAHREVEVRAHVRLVQLALSDGAAPAPAPLCRENEACHRRHKDWHHH